MTTLENEKLLILWKEAKEGNKSSFSLLAESQYRILFNYGTSFTKDREILKDVIQDLFLRIWEQRAKIEIKVVSIYLIKALKNNLLYELKKNGRFLNSRDSNELFDVVDEGNIESEIIDFEQFTENELKIKEMINLLPKRQRQVLYLKFYEAFTNDQIAEIMNINKQSVANLIYNSLEALKSTLKFTFFHFLFYLMY